MAGHRQGLRRRRICGEDSRQGNPYQADHRVAVRHQDPQGHPAEIHRRRRNPALPDEGKRPRILPVHRRRLRLQARERGSDPHVRRRGRRLPHQPPLQARLRGHAGQAPVHRLRFGDAVRLRPRRASGHLRQDRQLRRLDRHARRHEGALRRLRPLLADHLGVDDDQRPGADHPRLLLQYRHRRADRQVRDGQRPPADRGRSRENPRMDPVDRARHGAGRHPQGRPGPEHLHLQHRIRAQDDGRHPGILRAQPGAELLLGVDFRLPHRRSRGQPDQPARLHAVQRLHLRRVAIWRAACTSTTSRPT